MIRILIAGIPANVNNYVAAVTASGMEPVVSLDIPDDTALSRFDGLILPGGADVHPSRYGQSINGSEGIDEELDDKQFAILDCFVKAGKPILGICKGHQVINVYFGGDLIQDLGTDGNAIHRYVTADKVHMTHAEPGSWLAKLYGTDFATNSAHHQAVDHPAPGFQIIQRTEDGVVESIAHPELPILSLQWHPERMCYEKRREDTVDGSKIFLYFKTLCEKASSQA